MGDGMADRAPRRPVAKLEFVFHRIFMASQTAKRLALQLHAAAARRHVGSLPRVLAAYHCVAGQLSPSNNSLITPVNPCQCGLFGVVKYDSQHVALAGAQPADAVTHIDAVNAACALNRPVMYGEDHRLSL